MSQAHLYMDIRILEFIGVIVDINMNINKTCTLFLNVLKCFGSQNIFFFFGGHSNVYFFSLPRFEELPMNSYSLQLKVMIVLKNN